MRVTILGENLNLFEGFILSVIADRGPDVRVNLSKVEETTALSLAVQGMTLIGLGSQKPVTGMHGPFPVSGQPDMKTLIFTFIVSTEDTEDERILKGGRVCALFILFKSDKVRNVLRAAGLIESYLALLTEDRWKTERDLTEESIRFVQEKILDMVTTPRVRTFKIDNEGQIFEFYDDRMIPRSTHLIIVDEGKRQLYFITPPGADPFKSRELAIAVNKMNSEYYRSGLRVNKLVEFFEIEPILHTYGIETY